MEYIQQLEKLNEAKQAFKQAFENIDNAVISKSQTNDYAVKYKYPVLISLCLLGLAVIYFLMFFYQFFDVFFIICTSVLTLGLVFFIYVMLRTHLLVRKNAIEAEKITYYNGKSGRMLYTCITGGGEKIEWKDASIYFLGDDFELVESKGKEYQAYLLKNYHGHSRGYRLLSVDWLIDNFFEGRTVLSEKDEEIELSSGFSFKISYGRLIYFVIDGFYDECYENNFPIVSIMPQSKRYKFKYTFNSVNLPNFKFRVPSEVRTSAKYFGLTVPVDENIV